MSTKFFTNQNGTNTLLEKLQGIFQFMNIAEFDALVGYFRASGYFKILPYANKVAKIRILVGIDVDKLAFEANSKGLQFAPAPETTRELYAGKLRKDIQEAEYDQQVEEGMQAFISAISSGQIELRIHPSKQLHAKIYIFRQAVKHQHAGWGAVITGSSNLTEAGLERNFEFNVELRDHDDVEFATETFENLWNEAVPLTKNDVAEVKQNSYLNDNFTPFELYIKFLVEYFGKSIDYDPDDAKDLPLNYARLRYQVDAVNEGFEKLKRYNGFFLADVVGLGKTIVSILIAKKFAYYNGLRTRVLIVHPTPMEDSWRRTVNDFNLPFPIDYITTGSLHKVKNPENFDLVIVDEAHKFRSDTSDMFNWLQTLIKTPRRNPGPDGDSRKKVILVSATPLNNRPDDIRNLVLLFQDGRKATLDTVTNIVHYFRSKIDLYQKLQKEPDRNKALVEIKKMYEDIRAKIIQPLTVRRTRTDIQANDEYWKDVQAQGLSFPQVSKPQPIFYLLDSVLNDLFDDTVRIIEGTNHQGLQYFRYQAIKYLHEPYRKHYENAAGVSERLAGIMKTMLLKRLDSSFEAFIESLRRYRDANAAMIQMFDNNRVHIAPSLQVSEFILDGKEDELIEKMAKKRENDPTIQTFSADDFQEGFYRGLKQDQQTIEELYQRWIKWRRKHPDPKMAEFIERLEQNLLYETYGERRKLVVFSEYKDTTQYLAAELKRAGIERILCVDSENQKLLSDTIRRNFDARVDPKEQRNDYDIIITTEVLAEGVNLHRAYTLINYDTPWNSTRLMQRIGRVNRIGTHASHIYVYNFYPTEQTESQIELYKKALIKLQAFHAALGEDSQIYSSEEEYGTFGLFDKNISDEERDERLRYLLELRQFKANNREYFEQIKNMPLRSRTGRRHDQWQKCTVAFLKNQRQDGFYLVRNNQIEEISFLQCAAIFKAMVDEQPQPLTDSHFEDVKACLSHFADSQQTDLHQTQTASQFSPKEKRAFGILDLTSRLPFVNAEQKALIKLARQALTEHKFQKLQRDLNQLRKSEEQQKTNPVFVFEKLMEILPRYPLHELTQEYEISSDAIPLPAAITAPQIILSESFH